MNVTDSKQIVTSPQPFTIATVGKKFLMAVTGLFLVGFVFVHLIGNLQIFAGQEKLNAYAHTLQHLGAIKWLFRIFLAGFFVVHIWKGFVLWLENRHARPVAYATALTEKASIGARTMIYSGGLIFFFLLYHLLHFTLLLADTSYQNLPLDSAGRFDVYSMVIIGFSKPLISAVYTVAMIFLAFHLSHAISSLFQTLGLHNTKYMPKIKAAANLLAILIALAYISIPAAVLFKVVTLPQGGY